MTRPDTAWAIGLAVTITAVIFAALWLFYLGVQFLWGAFVNLLLILTQPL